MGPAEIEEAFRRIVAGSSAEDCGAIPAEGRPGIAGFWSAHGVGADRESVAFVAVIAGGLPSIVTRTFAGEESIGNAKAWIHDMGSVPQVPPVADARCEGGPRDGERITLAGSVVSVGGVRGKYYFDALRRVYRWHEP